MGTPGCLLSGLAPVCSKAPHDMILGGLDTQGRDDGKCYQVERVCTAFLVYFFLEA